MSVTSQEWLCCRADLIRELMSQGFTYEVSEYLVELAGLSEGLSPRTIWRYCADWGIRCQGGGDGD